MNFKDRLHNAIPGGAHTYSRGDDQFPSNAPEILSYGSGAYVYDADNKPFLDYGMGLRSVTLGYANEKINQAAFKQIQNGNNLTRASQIELEAAEAMISTIPSFEMVKFCKNGSNATTAAIKLARAFTGRDLVCIPSEHPFFSFDDWFIGTTPMTRGVPTTSCSNTLTFSYQDISSLDILFETFPNKIAAVIMEPGHCETPCKGAKCEKNASISSCIACPSRDKNILVRVQELCNANDAVFILDEMISGFRWHIGGAQTYFGVTPDLSTFGKGMANGFSLAAVGGRRDIMDLGSINADGEERTFLLSSTHGSEMASLGAFLATLEFYKTHNVCEHLWRTGKLLREIFDRAIKKYDLKQYFELVGPDISQNFVAKDKKCQNSMEFRTLFSQEMVKRGVLMPWIAPSYAHGEKELEITENAVEGALGIYAKAISSSVFEYLENNHVIKPVFRKYN